MRSQSLLYFLTPLVLLLAAFFSIAQPSAYAAPLLALTQTAEANTPQPTDTPTSAPTDTPTSVPTDTPTPPPTDTPTPPPTDTPMPPPTDTPPPPVIGGGGDTATPVPTPPTPTPTPLPPETLPETGAEQTPGFEWLPLALLSAAALLGGYLLRRRLWARE